MGACLCSGEHCIFAVSYPVETDYFLSSIILVLFFKACSLFILWDSHFGQAISLTLQEPMSDVHCGDTCKDTQ